MPSGRPSGLGKDWQEADIIKIHGTRESESVVEASQESKLAVAYHAIFFMYFVCVCASLYHDSYLGMVLSMMVCS